MLYIRIELWPGGNKNHPRAGVIAEATVSNVGGTPTSGNYQYRLLGKKGAPMNGGIVVGFPRKRLMAWDLLLGILRHARHSKGKWYFDNANDKGEASDV